VFEKEHSDEEDMVGSEEEDESLSNSELHLDLDSIIKPVGNNSNNSQG
jgi:hypothetical protein